MKILLVDDDDDVRFVGALSLRKVGQFDVTCAVSGADALEKLRAGDHYDAVVLDMMMPGLDGMATFSALRNLSECAELPVIFMTAKAQPGEVAHYLGAGAAGVIRKPFDPMQLPREIREILEGLALRPAGAVGSK